MARLRLTPPPNSSPQAEPNPAEPGMDPQAGLPMHLTRPKPVPVAPPMAPGELAAQGQPLSGGAWQQQYDQIKAGGGLGALAAQDAQPAPLGVDGRIAEGFEGLARGGMAGLASATQAIRAPFHGTADGVGAAPMDDFGSGGYEDPGLGVVVPSSGRVDDPIGAGLGRFADEQRAQIAGMQSPASRGAGFGADLVTGMVPYLNPVTGAVTGGGNAQLQGKSGLGIATNAALGAVPGAVGSATSRGIAALGGRMAPPIVADTLAQGALGAGMAAGTAAETQLFEDNPELAAQEWEMVAPTGAGLGALGAITSMMTRGRGAFGAPRPAQPPVGAQRQVDLEPVAGGPARGEPSPFQQEAPFAAEYGDRAGQSPFGQQFDMAPRADIDPEFRASTVSADPVMTGPDGRPPLPDVVLGEPPVLGARAELPPEGLPAGEPGEWRPAADFPGEAPVEGYRDFNPAPTQPREPEFGARPAQPRRQDIQPQRNDPTSLGEVPIQGRRPDIQPERGATTVLGEAPIRDPLAEYKQRGVDPNAETMIGETYLDPVDDYLPPAEPLPNGSIRGNNTAKTDPYGDIDARLAEDRRQEALGNGVEPEPLMRPEYDPNLPETELQLDPVAQRAEMATEPEMAPPSFKPGARDVREEGRRQFTGATTRITPAKPGLAHLSPEAQEFVASVKPGERELLKDSIDYFKQNPDPQGDVGNLQMVLDMARAKRERKPGARPKLTAPGEGAPLKAPAQEVRAPRLDAPITRDAGTPPVPSREVPGKNAESPAPTTPESVKAESQEHINYGGIPTDGLHAAARGIGGALQLGGGVAKKGLDVWAKRLYKVVADLPGGKPAAEKAQKVIDRTREFMGKFDGDRQRFLKELHGNGPKSKAARKSFAEVQWDGDVGFSRLNDILDGAADARPYEKPAVNAFRSAFLDTGKLAEEIGYKIGVGGKMVPFKADPKRLRSPRIGTDALHWYSNRPNHPETQRLAAEIAKLNPGMTPEQVMGELDFWTERGVSKRGMAEEARTIENFPTHYRNSDGRVIQLLSDDPVRIIDAVTRRFPARMAYVTEFGQGSVPKELAALGKPGEAAAENLFRSLNGMPLDPPIGLDNAPPGSAQSDAMGWINIPWTALKGLKLSMAPLANAPETMGKGRSIAGSSPLKLAKAGFDVSWMNRNADAIVDDLANRGAMTRDVMDWYWNKSDLPETLNRYTLNGTGAVNQFVNEFNEKMIARMSDQWTKALKEGKGGMVDRFRLKVLEFKPGEIDAIMSGKAPKKTYDAVLGRAVEWAQGSTSQPAERSRAAGTRWWNWATIADRFAQMNINRNFGVWAKVGETLADGNSTWKDRLGAVTFAADLTGGQVAAAATTLMLRAMVVGGAGVLTDKAFGSPLGLQDFLLDATKYALLGGPVQAIVQGTTQERGEGLGESLANMVLPVSTAQDIVDAFAGRGQYEGMTGVEAAAKLLKSSTPITAAGANIAAVAGLAQDNPKLDAGIKEFWNWRRKYAPTPRVEGSAGDEQTTAFRAAMRKAGNAMRDGAYPGEAINAALGVKDAKTVAQSLRSRKLLKTLKPEQLQAVTEYLGPDTLSELHAYDDLLENWATMVSPKKR